MVARGSQSLWGQAGAAPWPGARERCVWALGCVVGTHKDIWFTRLAFHPCPTQSSERENCELSCLVLTPAC